MMIHIVLLSGGSGSRLWPLSNPSLPKQFLELPLGDDGQKISMAQRVFAQICAIDADIDVTIATNSSQIDLIEEQLNGQYALSIEPERRDTAPAIFLAGAFLASELGANEDDPVIVMPIDTYADQEYYAQIPKLASTISSGVSELVLLGVKPTYPSSKYGYIVPETIAGELLRVASFCEKPDRSRAQDYISRGGLWNCGVFGFRLGWLQNLTGRYTGAASYSALIERYRDLPKNSFDYEVVERATSASVIPYDGAWKDLGTWDALSEEMDNRLLGSVWADDTSQNGSLIINDTDMPLVVSGISNVVVIATPDGILVSGMEACDNIKNLVTQALEGSSQKT